jgi:hypothetical protein
MEEVARFTPPQTAEHAQLPHVIGPPVVKAVASIEDAQGSSIERLARLFYDAIGGVLLILHLAQAFAESRGVIDAVTAALVACVPPLKERINNTRHGVTLKSGL